MSRSVHAHPLTRPSHITASAVSPLALHHPFAPLSPSIPLHPRAPASTENAATGLYIVIRSHYKRQAPVKAITGCARLHRKTDVIPDYNVTAVSRRFTIRFDRQWVHPIPPSRAVTRVSVASIIREKLNRITGWRCPVKRGRLAIGTEIPDAEFPDNG